MKTLHSNHLLLLCILPFFTACGYQIVSPQNSPLGLPQSSYVSFSNTTPFLSLTPIFHSAWNKNLQRDTFKPSFYRCFSGKVSLSIEDSNPWGQTLVEELIVLRLSARLSDKTAIKQSESSLARPILTEKELVTLPSRQGVDVEGKLQNHVEHLVDRLIFRLKSYCER